MDCFGLKDVVDSFVASIIWHSYDLFYPSAAPGRVRKDSEGQAVVASDQEPDRSVHRAVVATIAGVDYPAKRRI